LILFWDVLCQASWSGEYGIALLACFGFVVVFKFFGIRWFRWDAH
jgi:ABC-2 type transport system permease protein